MTAEFPRAARLCHGAMRLSSRNAVLKGIAFTDGTIGFDFNTVLRGGRVTTTRRHSRPLADRRPV
jgi:hypothetical protein